MKRSVYSHKGLRKKRKKNVYSRGIFTYAFAEHVRNSSAYSRTASPWKIIIHCCVPSILFPLCLLVHCQKNKKDEDKKDEEFRCPEGQGNGNFADPATCRRFYQVIKFRVASVCRIIGQLDRSLSLSLIIRIIIIYMSFCRLIVFSTSASMDTPT